MRVPKQKWRYAVLACVAMAALVFGVHRYFSNNSRQIQAAIIALNKPDSKLNRGVVQTWRKLPLGMRRYLSWLAPTLAAEKRLQGCAALARFGAKAAQATPALLRALSDVDPRVASAAVAALGAIGPAAKEALPPLLTALNGNSTNTLSATSPEIPVALARIAPENLEIVETLLRKSRDPAISAHVNRALGELARSSPYGLQVWKEVAKTQTVFEGPSVPPGISLVLTSGFPNAVISLSRRVNWPAGKVSVEVWSGAIPLVAEALLENPHVSAADRVEVACALIMSQRPERVNCGLRIVQRIGPEAATAVPCVLAAFSNEPQKLRRLVSPASAKPVENSVGVLALRALGAIGPSAGEAIPALSGICENVADPLRFEAALARCRIDGNCSEAMSVLSLGCHDPSLETREVAFAGVVTLAELCDINHELLLMGMRDPEHRIRQRAIRALPKGQPLPPALQQSLTRLLNDPSFAVRVRATNRIRHERTNPN